MGARDDPRDMWNDPMGSIGSHEIGLGGWRGGEERRGEKRDDFVIETEITMPPLLAENRGVQQGVPKISFGKSPFFPGSYAAMKDCPPGGGEVQQWGGGHGKTILR